MVKIRELSLKRKIEFLNYAQVKIINVSPITADDNVDLVALCVLFSRWGHFSGTIKVSIRFPELMTEISKAKLKNTLSQFYIYWRTPRYAVKGRLLLLERVRKQLLK